MPLSHNVIRQTQPQPRALPRRLGGEKRLEDFVADGFRNTIAVVLDPNNDLIVIFLCRKNYGRLVRSVGVTRSHADTSHCPVAVQDRGAAGADQGASEFAAVRRGMF